MTAPAFRPGVAPCQATLTRSEVRAMIQVVTALQHLATLPAYQEALALELPLSARFDPGHASVLMGYDFHSTPDGPRLIEINTNAGGALLAWQAQYPELEREPYLAHRSVARVLDSFFQEYAQFRRDPRARPARMVILDDNPHGQFLYPEMALCARLFQQLGLQAQVVAPEELDGGAEGLYYQGERVELIYNRHCDFYLETSPLGLVRDAWLAGTVCLTPNPRSYGLLADKRRLPLFCSAARLQEFGLSPAQAATVAAHLPNSRLLESCDRALLWGERNRLVFKPVTLHGGRGVLPGEGISRPRFDALPDHETLVQAFVSPAPIHCPHSPKPLKSDLRLFVYQQQIQAVGVRIYQGQVTNFRTPGNGYGSVRIV